VQNGSDVLSVSYGLEHVETDLHRSFPLVRLLPIKPAPILAVGNTVHVVHLANMVQVCEGPSYPRVLLKGDWT
jgi:hypothetical protein